MKKSNPIKNFIKKIEAKKEDWKSVSPEFNREFQKKWENENISYEECKKWISVGFIPREINFISWLKERNKTPESLGNDIENLRKKYEKSRVRNIILIGRTGNGKSTLANVLVNKFDKDNKFQEIFEEGEFATSKTKEIKDSDFSENDIKYNVVDTVGIGDTHCSREQVLDELAKACLKVKGNISQIFFVTKDRFTKEEKVAYNLLSNTIFDSNVSKYTTIVRTNFYNFANPKKCEEDRKALIENNEDITELTSANVKIIHVNNPPINIDSDDEIARKQIALNKEIRELSRKKLLECLEKCVDAYETENFYWKFYDELENLIEERKKTIDELEKVKNKLKKREKRESITGKVNTGVQAAAGVASSIPADMYLVSMPLNILSIVSGAVNGYYTNDSFKFQRKIFREFKEQIDADKKVQEECSRIKEILEKENDNSKSEIFATMLDQIDNVIKEFKIELEKLEDKKDKHEEKLKSWNQKNNEEEIKSLAVENAIEASPK